MNGRSYDERMQRRRARAATGRTSLQVSNATKSKIDELVQLIPPFDGVYGADELLDELLDAELERRRNAQGDPAQLDALDSESGAG